MEVRVFGDHGRTVEKFLPLVWWWGSAKTDLKTLKNVYVQRAEQMKIGDYKIDSELSWVYLNELNCSCFLNHFRQLTLKNIIKYTVYIKTHCILSMQITF